MAIRDLRVGAGMEYRLFVLEHEGPREVILPADLHIDFQIQQIDLVSGADDSYFRLELYL